MTKKILFIMHLDWKYVKQRPHFIAEELSNVYDLNVVYFYSKHYLFRNSSNKTPNDKKISITPAFRLPFYENDLVYKLNKIYMRLYFKLLIRRYKPDLLWITFPLLYDYIPIENNCKIIYDCMDNLTSENFEEKFLKRLLNLEKKLLEKAELIFVPSESLAYKLNKRQKSLNKLFVIRNAFDGKMIDNLSDNNKKKKIYKIGYVGTVSSEGFDFELLENSLKKFDNIEYHIIGPLDNKKLNLNNKIKLYGAIEHGKLYDYTKNFDAMIMPFKLNELIKVVDPVKFYEYINYNKPIISIYYDEIDRYKPFVSFYSNNNQFFDILEELIDKKFEKKYSDNDRIKFLKNNTWNDRVKKIINVIDSFD
jgi:teichuronic acid biosynthesis glycosyltransferase TuaH